MWMFKITMHLSFRQVLIQFLTFLYITSPHNGLFQVAINYYLLKNLYFILKMTSVLKGFAFATLKYTYKWCCPYVVFSITLILTMFLFLCSDSKIKTFLFAPPAPGAFLLLQRNFHITILFNWVCLSTRFFPQHCHTSCYT